MKNFKRSINGVAALDIFCQDPLDLDHMQRMSGCTLIIEPFSENGKAVFRIMPDLHSIGKPKVEDKYKAVPHDDLLTMAISRGIPVKRDTLTSDLQKILATADTDMDAAIKLAENARPAIQATGKDPISKEYSGAVPMRFTSYSATL